MTVRSAWGMACPHCHSDSSLDVAATIWVRLFPDGTDADEAQHQGHEWASNSSCQCAACDWSGTVADAERACL